MNRALVKLIEDDAPDPGKLWIGDQLPQQNALGFKLDARRVTHAVLEPDLIADFPPQLHLQLLRHAGSQHAGSETTRLQHHALPIAKQSVLQQNLRHLGGLARAGGRLKHQPTHRF